MATTGDDVTGLADLLPAPKYAKGYATTRAVEVNGQLTLDFGDFGLAGLRDHLPPRDDLLTWLLLFHSAGDDGFHVELSLPDRIEDGRITSWAERIILPVFPGTRSAWGTGWPRPTPPGTGASSSR